MTQRSKHKSDVMSLRPFLALFFCISGALFCRSQNPFVQLLAWTLACAGGVQISILARDAWRSHRLAERQRQQKALQDAKRQSRREKDAEEREQQAKYLQQAQEQHAKAIAARDALRQQRRAALLAKQQEQERIETAIFVEVERLEALSPSELCEEIESAWRKRGFQKETEIDSLPPNSWLMTQAEHREIWQFLETEAQYSDLMALEQARKEAGADHATLCAYLGFSLDAVMGVSAFPITLLDQYALAAWLCE